MPFFNIAVHLQTCQRLKVKRFSHLYAVFNTRVPLGCWQLGGCCSGFTPDQVCQPMPSALCHGAGRGGHTRFPSASPLSNSEVFLKLSEGCEHSWGSLMRDSCRIWDLGSVY